MALSKINTQNHCVIEAPFGCLGIMTEASIDGLILSKIEFLPATTPLSEPRDELAMLVAKHCKTYFKNPTYQFEFDKLPTKIVGTEHQQKVSKFIRDIPSGSTVTYGEIASAIGSGARVVGSACGANPFPIITPCHRVVSAQGIGGFMKENSPGIYREIKSWLLKHEGSL